MRMPSPLQYRRAGAIVALALLATPFTLLSAAPGDDRPTTMQELPPEYLSPELLPDSLALLPPPPAPDSAAFARDEEISRTMTRSPDSARWQQAVRDANLHMPEIERNFSCALGRIPDAGTTPALTRLFQKAMIDIGLSTYRAKNKYQRVRPFVAHGNASCTPADEAMLAKDGSYPSGHSALGWGWALILAEIAPGRADAILQRGRDFGQSRLVCNVHWASDVDAGRLIASATVARLHADPTFLADLATAKDELHRAARPAEATCLSEAAALAN